MIHKSCVICEEPLSATGARIGSQLCKSAHCEIAISEHLRKGLRCCGACGCPIPNFSEQNPFGLFCSRAECRTMSHQMSVGNAAFCTVCGIHLDSRQDGAGLCQSPFCRRKDFCNKSAAKSLELSMERATRQKEVSEIVQKRSFELRPELRQETLLTVVVLPFLEYNLSAPSQERKSRVALGLLTLANEAYAQLSESAATPELESQKMHSDEATNESSGSDSHESAYARLNGAACGTCGGKCCNMGEDGAFLNAEKFKTYFLARPQASPDEAVASYIARIPDKTFEDSCIFHGLSGCGLTRSQRAVTCNTYLCSSLQSLLNAKREPSSSFLMAATNFRDTNKSEPKVYRILYVGEKSETIIPT